ncbi:ABC transporter permease [Bacillus wiedmannii]|uniref:ABC transporter permease n=1 Tax=Bacillus wiedmannii TaxID=1890302 RepID=UPI002E20E4E0|nr:ABC transporter permease [Bacillus wiedmannii]
MNKDEYIQADFKSVNHESQTQSLGQHSPQPPHQSCAGEVNHSVPFCCVVNVPHGFHYVPNGKQEVAYSLDCLSIVEETCKKTIVVEDCGPVEVKLRLIKAVGCIPIIANASVKGDCGTYCEDSSHGHHIVKISCSDTICVDNILKCSIDCVPDYEINCHNVVLSNFKVTPLQECGCQMLQFTGTIEFKNNL